MHHGPGGEAQDYPALLLARPCGFLVGTGWVEGRGYGCRAGGTGVAPGPAWTGCIGIISSISGGDCPPGGTLHPHPPRLVRATKLRRVAGVKGSAGLGCPWDPVILRPEDDWLVWGMAGSPVPSVPAEFSSVCVPFWERLILRRASRGDFL